MTVYLVISLPKLPGIHRIHRVLANPAHRPCLKYCTGTLAPNGSLSVQESRHANTHKPPPVFKVVRFPSLYKDPDMQVLISHPLCSR